jgi:CRP-like cAMP-binding protein
MLQATSPRLYHSTLPASRQVARPKPDFHSPRQNQLLAALPSHVYDRLLPHLEPLSLPRGLRLHSPGEHERYIHFLTSGLVSRSYGTQDGLSTGFSLTGREGAVGLSLFMGGGGTPIDVTLVSPGYAYRMRADRLEREFAGSGPLAQVLLRFTMALIVQSGQTAACNRHHSIRQQLSRVLLTCADRTDSNDLALTQEALAEHLGVRREGVTKAAGELQQLGMISYSRGHIAVKDHSGLEMQSCECYGVVAREYARLLPARSRMPYSSSSIRPSM